LASTPLVLVVDDEPHITKLSSMALESQGIRSISAASGLEALDKAEKYRPDLVLLDIVIPDIDGLEVMQRLRTLRPVPIIVVTGKGSGPDRARGLDLGADDYVVKPFHADELVARVRAVLRRSAPDDDTPEARGVVAFDGIVIDLEKRTVTRDGEPVPLSRNEWLLLQHLAEHPGKVILHSELLTKVWGAEYENDVPYLRVWMSRVRHKLGLRAGSGGRIKTYLGIGYRLDVEGH
jgi:two-component system KDP operon response regulator KdpE